MTRIHPSLSYETAPSELVISLHAQAREQLTAAETDKLIRVLRVATDEGFYPQTPEEDSLSFFEILTATRALTFDELSDLVQRLENDTAWKKEEGPWERAQRKLADEWREQSVFEDPGPAPSLDGDVWQQEGALKSPKPPSSSQEGVHFLNKALQLEDCESLLKIDLSGFSEEELLELALQLEHLEKRIREAGPNTTIQHDHHHHLTIKRIYKIPSFLGAAIAYVERVLEEKVIQNNKKEGVLFYGEVCRRVRHRAMLLRNGDSLKGAGFEAPQRARPHTPTMIRQKEFRGQRMARTDSIQIDRKDRGRRRRHAIARDFKQGEVPCSSSEFPAPLSSTDARRLRRRYPETDRPIRKGNLERVLEVLSSRLRHIMTVATPRQAGTQLKELGHVLSPVELDQVLRSIDADCPEIVSSFSLTRKDFNNLRHVVESMLGSSGLLDGDVLVDRQTQIPLAKLSTLELRRGKGVQGKTRLSQEDLKEMAETYSKEKDRFAERGRLINRITWENQWKRKRRATLRKKAKADNDQMLVHLRSAGRHSADGQIDIHLIPIAYELFCGKQRGSLYDSVSRLIREGDRLGLDSESLHALRLLWDKLPRRKAGKALRSAIWKQPVLMRVVAEFSYEEGKSKRKAPAKEKTRYLRALPTWHFRR